MDYIKEYNEVYTPKAQIAKRMIKDGFDTSAIVAEIKKIREELNIKRDITPSEIVSALARQLKK